MFGERKERQEKTLLIDTISTPSTWLLHTQYEISLVNFLSFLLSFQAGLQGFIEIRNLTAATWIFLINKQPSSDPPPW